MMIPLNHPINSEKQEGTETILLIWQMEEMRQKFSQWLAQGHVLGFRSLSEDSSLEGEGGASDSPDDLPPMQESPSPTSLTDGHLALEEAALAILVL